MLYLNALDVCSHYIFCFLSSPFLRYATSLDWIESLATFIFTIIQCSSGISYLFCRYRKIPVIRSDEIRKIHSIVVLHSSFVPYTPSDKIEFSLELSEKLTSSFHTDLFHQGLLAASDLGN